MLALTSLALASRQIIKEGLPARSSPPAFFSSCGVVLHDDGRAFVSTCGINLTLAPTIFPFFDDLAKATGCDGRNVEDFELHALAAMLRSELDEERWARPSGFIIHAMRVGSTAAANMVGGHPDVVVLKEASALTSVLLWPLHDEATKRLATLALRVVAQLFFRAAASQRQKDFGRARAAQTALVFKLASSSTASALQLSVLRDAFPDVPFAYLIRDPATSVASLLATPSTMDLTSVPCLRWRGRPPSRQLPTLLDRARTNDPFSLSMEQYCAAHLAALHHSMSEQVASDAEMTRRMAYDDDGGGWSLDSPLSLVLDHSSLPGTRSPPSSQTSQHGGFDWSCDGPRSYWCSLTLLMPLDHC